MNILLFEIDAVNIKRYFYDVIEFAQADRIHVALDSSVQCNIFMENYSELNFHDVKDVGWWSIKKIEEYLISNNIQRVIVDAHRIPDIRVIVASRNVGVKVVYIQHGLYIRFMRRSYKFFLAKIFKTLRYLYYAVDIGLNSKLVSTLLLIWVHVFGGDRCKLSTFKNFFPHSSLVFSSYWRKWHIEMYGFPDGEFNIIGTPDLKKYKFSNESFSGYVAYCYQTLVEDGRIHEKVMNNFYAELISFCNSRDKKLVVKGHPRMGGRFLDFFQDNEIRIVFDEIPKADFVIGHYSTLMPFWAINGTRVYCYELPEHQIPESIAGWAISISDFRDFDRMNNQNNAEMSFYYENFIGSRSVAGYLTR